MSATRLKVLMALWEGGGNIPPELGVARRLVRAGHEVDVIADPLVEERARAAGCSFTPWRRAPHSTSLRPDDYFMKDWDLKTPFATLKRMRDVFIAGPSSAYAAETWAVIEERRPHVVVPDYFLFGSAIAAQASDLPVVPMIPNVWMIPAAGMPPVGPGFQPATSPVGRLRDRVMVAMTERLMASGTQRLNQVRSEYGLDPLGGFWDQVLGAEKILVLTSPAFDFSSAYAPENAIYTGPIRDDPQWAGSWDFPWSDDGVPLVLVGFSSLFQDQVTQLRNVVEALSSLPVRGVVTTGRAVDPADVESTENVAVVTSAPHSRILERASVTVTHAGHGTTIKSLAAGVPLVCIPMGRDQLDTAARVVRLGAGVKVGPGASASRIRRAVQQVLGDDAYGAAARRMAESIRAEQGVESPLDVIEQTARRASAGAK